MNGSASVTGWAIAKNVFVAVGLDERGKLVLKKKLARCEVLTFFANLKPVAVGIEACAGAHYWARKLKELGYDARLIAAQHVKPFVSGSQNDTNDAHAIAEVRARAWTKYVPINTEAQQDLQIAASGAARCHGRAQSCHLPDSRLTPGLLSSPIFMLLTTIKT